MYCKYCLGESKIEEDKYIFFKNGKSYLKDIFGEHLLDKCPICESNLVGIYDLDWLYKYADTTEKPLKYVYFWQVNFNKCKNNFVSGPEILSQWFPSVFKDKNGDVYKNAEQFMMYQKAVLFKDFDVAEQIMQTIKPNEMKALGRKVKNFNQEIWAKECKKIVLIGNFYKFSQNEKLKKYLLSTKNEILVEASPFDEIWGIKLSQEDAFYVSCKDWKGTNYLGFILMTVRDILNEKQDLKSILNRF